MWVAIGLLLPVGVLYLHGWGTVAPVYWAGASVIDVALTIWCVRASRILAPPRSYRVLVALAVYLLLSDAVRGEGLSPNAGNLALGVTASLLVFMAPAARASLRGVQWGVLCALVIIGIDRVVQFTNIHFDPCFKKRSRCRRVVPRLL